MNAALKRLSADERGIGMIEIVISMVLLGIIIVSFLPLLVSTLIASRQNTTLTTATQLVSTQVQAAKTLTPGTCPALTTFVGATLTPITDPRGLPLMPHRALIGSCAATYPTTAKVRVWITKPDGAVVSEAYAIVPLAGS